MNPARDTRLHKQTWPELYCTHKPCLWRVKRDGQPDTPCPKHTKLPQERIAFDGTT